MDARAETLSSVVERLSGSRSLERITGVVTSAVRRLLGADGATFVLREDGKCFYVDEDAIGPLWTGSRFPLEACISGWAMLHGEVVVIPDIYQDERIPHDAYRPTFVRSLCMTPVGVRDPVAAIGAYWAEEHVTSDVDVRLLQVIANAAAVALENLELRGAMERRSAERDALADRADELMAAIHTLVHDLRGPLGAMMGFAELAEEMATEDPGKVASFARTIQATGARMAEQIDRMLALYRITSRPLAREAVDLTDLARTVAADLTDRLDGRDVVITVDDGLRAHADPVLAQLLIQNLLDNAVKYTGRRPTAVIEIASVEQDARDITFVVRDNGDGFEASEADRLFQPLHRLHSEDDFPGTGLGLASVARIAELHGGRVRAEGRRGEGAAFYVTLPRAA